MASSKPNPKDDLQNRDHSITREEAREYISTFRRSKTKLLHPDLAEADKYYGVIPESEAFNEKSILEILSQPGCIGIRIHYGLKFKKDRKIKGEIPMIVAVLVGVDKDGKNIWTKPKRRKTAMKANASGAVMAVAAAGFEEDASIKQDSQRCPPFPSSQPQP